MVRAGRDPSTDLETPLLTTRIKAHARARAADLLGNPPEWQELACCQQADPDAFFPEKGGSTREARRICGSCEVKDACLEYALEHDERFGIWGGMSERERRKVRRRALP